MRHSQMTFFWSGGVRRINGLLLYILSAPIVTHALRSLAKVSQSAERRGQISTLVFVTPPKEAGGWILDAIVREVGERLVGTEVRYVPFGTPLPPADRYFFSHYMYYVGSLKSLGWRATSRSYVYATHLEPEKHGISNKLLARVLNSCDGVICMNSSLRGELASLGVESIRLKVAVGAASSQVFRPHSRLPAGKVGFCSAYYPRKSPDLVVEIVRGLPGRGFVLIGRGWQEYPRFAELLALPNFEYIEAEYSEYPIYYAQMTVFVSVSQLEGGPIPLLEAMMSNVVPVASRTGFAPDVINHGANGFLFDVGASAVDVCELIERAFELQYDVCSTVAFCDWVPFSHRIGEFLGLRGISTTSNAARKGPL